MPTFKDIDSFVQKTPDGTEKIQVSATQCVTLQQIANLAKIGDSDIMAKKLSGLSRVPDYVNNLDEIKASSTLIQVINALISSINPIVDGFSFRILSHSNKNTGFILQMISPDNDLSGTLICNVTKKIWGFGNLLLEDSNTVDEAIETVSSGGSLFSFSSRPWVSSNEAYSGTVLKPNCIHSVSGDYLQSSSYAISINDEWASLNEAVCIIRTQISFTATSFREQVVDKLSAAFRSGGAVVLGPPINSDWELTLPEASDDQSEGDVYVDILVNKIGNTVYVSTMLNSVSTK